MQRTWKTKGSVITAVCLLVSISAFAQGGDKAKVKGMIISRTGDTVVLRNADGTTTVLIDDDTRVQRPTGILSKKQVSDTVLIPGLKVSVDGMTDEQNRVVAKTINFDPSDLETAEMIQAGLHPTAEQVAANQQAIAGHSQDIAANQQATAANSKNISANKQATETNKAAIDQNIKDIQEANDRFSQLADYDVKYDLTLNFKVGSSTISSDDQRKLKDLAQKASALTGYLIEVKGFADSTGNAAMNTKLSGDRADAVTNYLVQQGVAIRHIVAPGAYGETFAAASNETASGRAENRRVEVKVLINKGIAGN